MLEVLRRNLEHEKMSDSRENASSRTENVWFRLNKRGSTQK